MLDFERLQSALERLGANTDAAEAHGTLCALLLDNATLATWLAHTLDELPDEGNVLAAEHLGVLETVYADTRARLGHEDLDFAPLLPDESEDFGIRLLALAGWCQGFLYGAGVAALHQDERLDDDARECLSDLLEISKLGHDAEPGEEAELQYAEIVEHLRVTMLLLNDCLNPLPQKRGQYT